MLTVLSRAKNDAGGSARWDCVCDCGARRVIAGTAIRDGRHKSCGCNSPRFRAAENPMSKSRIYRIWQGMLTRCSPKATGKTKRLYFDKGIRVCDEWMSFDIFLRDMGAPLENHSIDRINGDLGYFKSNCRWATHVVQANNTSKNHRVDFRGEAITIAELSRRTGVKQNTLLYRIRRGWSIDRAVQLRPKHKLAEIKESRARNCPVCGNVFIPRTAQIASGAGKHCSHKCSAASKKTIGRLL